MKITIGTFDPATRTVAVEFEQDDIAHKRNVNACLDRDGAYDALATAARVDQVALGVAAKISLGVIQPAPEPTPEPAPVDPETPPTDPALGSDETDPPVN